MKRLALILAVVVGLAVTAAPAMAYYPYPHHHRPYYPPVRYGVGYVPTYGTSISVGLGVPTVGFNYSDYPTYGYGYGYPGYRVNYGYPAASFASPAAFGYGPAAVFGY